MWLEFFGVVPYKESHVKKNNKKEKEERKDKWSEYFCNPHIMMGEGWDNHRDTLFKKGAERRYIAILESSWACATISVDLENRKSSLISVLLLESSSLWLLGLPSGFWVNKSHYFSHRK